MPDSEIKARKGGQGRGHRRDQGTQDAAGTFGWKGQRHMGRIPMDTIPVDTPTTLGERLKGQGGTGEAEIVQATRQGRGQGARASGGKHRVLGTFANAPPEKPPLGLKASKAKHGIHADLVWRRGENPRHQGRKHFPGESRTQAPSKEGVKGVVLPGSSWNEWFGQDPEFFHQRHPRGHGQASKGGGAPVELPAFT